MGDSASDSAGKCFAHEQRALCGAFQCVAGSRGNRSPFPVEGGTIDRVVIDVSGDPYIDREKEVLTYLSCD